MSNTMESLNTDLEQGWPVPSEREYESTLEKDTEVAGPSPTMVAIRLRRKHQTWTGIPQGGSGAALDEGEARRRYMELHQRAQDELEQNPVGEPDSELTQERQRTTELLSPLEIEGIVQRDDDGVE